MKDYEAHIDLTVEEYCSKRPYKCSAEDRKEIQEIEDLVEKTRNCKYFSTLDINSAFWSIPLRIEDRKKTAFVTQEGHLQWTCLPFGLKTSPEENFSEDIKQHNKETWFIRFFS